MLGLSLGKLLFLAIVITLVWYGFKYVSRVAAVQQRAKADMMRRRGQGNVEPPRRPVEDLVKCQRCGSFVSAEGAGNCGKPGCPWGH